MRILVIEDNHSLNQSLQMHFEESGYQVSGETTIAGALASIRSNVPDLIMLDQQLPDGHGIELLSDIQQHHDDMPVIMMTGAHDLDLAIKAIKIGAFDFIHKPIQMDALTHSVKRAFEHMRLSRQVAALQNHETTQATLGNMIGQSQAMLNVSKEIALVSESDARVLITGETGTGKEVVARAIHHHSQRKGLFLAVNSAAIVDTLMESELFGHEKGAFTGASSRKLGKFELAREGTLFLDEIGEMNLALQAKLLRVLQEGSFERVGGTQQLVTNARIIAATNRDLDQQVKEGHFREDLLYRLKTIQIHLPPLRERREDIALLCTALLEKLATALHKRLPTITDDALQQIVNYSWPGNVRELENVLTQALVRARKDAIITTEHINLPNNPPQRPNDLGTTQPLPSLAQIEAEHIQKVLEATAFHKGQTCSILEISRPALDRKIQKYGLGMNTQ